MKIFYTQKELNNYLDIQRSEQKKIALIPTMGALHEGHISLINYAKPFAECLVCSIFVNPTQFNDPKDLEKYPRPIERDIQLLSQVECDVLFLPAAEEMYPANDTDWYLNLGNLDSIWEGQHRPGHFQGVTQIVYKLFSLVKPAVAFFGQKDFQQIMVLKKMTKIMKMDIELIVCPTIRNDEGLALSSRNERLSSEGKNRALALFKALLFVRDNFNTIPISQLNDQAQSLLKNSPGITVEYLAICETDSLIEVQKIENGKKYVAIVAAYVEQVRLIDNLLLN